MSSSDINVKESEQKLDQELNNITPVIGTVIKSLFDSFNTTEISKNTSLPVASQLLAALPQLHSVLQNINEPQNEKHLPTQAAVAFGAKLLQENKINEKLRKTIDENLVQFDTLIEAPLVQQFLTTMDADPNQIKQAVHLHNASIHQRLTAFEPIVNAVRTRSQNHVTNIEHMIDEIISHPDRLITILFEKSPEIVTNFLNEKGFGKEQLEYLVTQIPIKSSILKEDLIEKLEKNGEMNKIENELKESSIEKFTLNNCLKQLTSTQNLQAFTTIINLLGQSAINQRKNKNSKD